MGRRHWFNDLARDTRDLEYLRRRLGPKTEEERKRFEKRWACCVFAVGGVIALLIIIVFVISIAGKSSRQQEPTAVSAPLGSLEEPTPTARTKRRLPSKVQEDTPTDIPEAIPEPTISPVLLIRYAQETDAGEQCLIKGNINSKGQKIYHIPGTSSYNSTKIDTSSGERWFCTEFDAIQAGWHAPGQ